MWFLPIILILFTCSRVFGEGEFSHDFGEDFGEVFTSESGICGSMRPWIHGDYNSTNFEPRDPNSTRFIEPQSSYTCTFSNNFTMSSGGQLQLSVHMYPRSSMDQVRLLVYESETNIIIGQITSSLDHANFEYGWNTFNITVEGSETFDGYVVIVGRATTASAILVDHILYVPPPEEPELVDCIGVDFGDLIDFTFKLVLDDSLPICDNAETWVRSTTNDGISGIKPNVEYTLSCISSEVIVFTSGILYIDVLIDSDSHFDYISVLINDNDVILNSVTYGKMINDTITSEVTTLEIPLDIVEEHKARITFIGVATRDATVLVKSFEFKPTHWNGQPCISFIDMLRHRFSI